MVILFMILLRQSTGCFHLRAEVLRKLSLHRGYSNDIISLPWILTGTSLIFWKFRGFDSSRILISRGGILMLIWNFLEILSQAILVGIILVGRLGVFREQDLVISAAGTCGRSGGSLILGLM